MTNETITERFSGPTMERLKLLRRKTREILRIYRKNRMGMTGLVLLVAFVVLAVFAPGVMWVLAHIASWPSVYGPFDEVAPIGLGLPASEDHWLGTDSRGFDILARTIYGSRVSLLIGFVATVVSMGLGTIVGLFSGFWGGWRDEILMRITDVFLVLPWLALMIVLAAVLPGGPSVAKVIFVIGITGWSGTARLVRAQVMSLRSRTFVERARSVGAGDYFIVRKHIFPNVFPLVFANSVLTVALSILSESTLSFIRLGPDPTKVVTWGNMLEDAMNGNAFLNGLYLWFLVPGICIVIVVLAFTLIGYALDEIFNPRLRRR
jgi:peptide/nickel transport system permease protein